MSTNDIIDEIATTFDFPRHLVECAVSRLGHSTKQAEYAMTRYLLHHTIVAAIKGLNGNMVNIEQMEPAEAMSYVKGLGIAGVLPDIIETELSEDGAIKHYTIEVTTTLGNPKEAYLHKRGINFVPYDKVLVVKIGKECSLFGDWELVKMRDAEDYKNAIMILADKYSKAAVEYFGPRVFKMSPESVFLENYPTDPFKLEHYIADFLDRIDVSKPFWNQELQSLADNVVLETVELPDFRFMRGNPKKPGWFHLSLPVTAGIICERLKAAEKVESIMEGKVTLINVGRHTGVKRWYGRNPTSADTMETFHSFKRCVEGWDKGTVYCKGTFSVAKQVLGIGYKKPCNMEEAIMSTDIQKDFGKMDWGSVANWFMSDHSHGERGKPQDPKEFATDEIAECVSNFMNEYNKTNMSIVNQAHRVFCENVIGIQKSGFKGQSTIVFHRIPFSDDNDVLLGLSVMAGNYFSVSKMSKSMNIWQMIFSKEMIDGYWNSDCFYHNDLGIYIYCRSTTLTMHVLESFLCWEKFLVVSISRIEDNAKRRQVEKFAIDRSLDAELKLEFKNEARWCAAMDSMQMFNNNASEGFRATGRVYMKAFQAKESGHEKYLTRSNRKMIEGIFPFMAGGLCLDYTADTLIKVWGKDEQLLDVWYLDPGYDPQNIYGVEDLPKYPWCMSEENGQELD